MAPGAGRRHLDLGRRVARKLDQHHSPARQRPDTIVSDNGTELTSNAILGRADETGVGWHDIAPEAAAERLHRELQRPAARRVAERDAVPVAAARPCGAGAGGAITTRNGRIRACRTTPRAYASALGGETGRDVFRWGSAPRPLATHDTEGSDQPRTFVIRWMRNGGHVSISDY